MVGILKYCVKGQKGIAVIHTKDAECIHRFRNWGSTYIWTGSSIL